VAGQGAIPSQPSPRRASQPPGLSMPLRVLWPSRPRLLMHRSRPGCRCSFDRRGSSISAPTLFQEARVLSAFPFSCPCCWPAAPRATRPSGSPLHPRSLGRRCPFQAAAWPDPSCWVPRPRPDHLAHKPHTCEQSVLPPTRALAISALRPLLTPCFRFWSHTAPYPDMRSALSVSRRSVEDVAGRSLPRQPTLNSHRSRRRSAARRGLSH
jgi:hypothetical protein